MCCVHSFRAKAYTFFMERPLRKLLKFLMLSCLWLSHKPDSDLGGFVYRMQFFDHTIYLNYRLQIVKGSPESLGKSAVIPLPSQLCVINVFTIYFWWRVFCTTIGVSSQMTSSHHHCRQSTSTSFSFLFVCLWDNDKSFICLHPIPRSASARGFRYLPAL